MAHVSSLYSISLRPTRFADISASSFRLGFAKCRKQHHVVCCKAADDNEEDHRSPSSRIQQEYGGSQRREVLLQTVFTAFSFPMLVSPALADNDVTEDFQTFSDDVNKFKISIPKDWQVGAGEPNGYKSITAFYPQETSSSSNVSVVITGLGADFTRMESFGKVEAFAENLVSGLDRSWQRPPGVTAKLIDSKSSKGFYYIEYSLQNPGESCRHIYTAIGMATNGWYNRLYTVTGQVHNPFDSHRVRIFLQFMEEESDKYSSKIEKAIASFRFI